ncbi:hypothetical protein AB0M80_05690 [Amycolatopsis sp. NPDC051045]|uniref:hypothetical protein n=1 Tax=Amycolatopsis sp. NPDC051045 TaxID=3156922 RepID=UPI00342C8F1E
MAGKEKYHAAEVTAWLAEHANADTATGRRAGRAVAGAWNRGEFYASATVPTLVTLLRAAGEPVTDADRLAEALARAFGVHLHDVAAWDPRPDWRKEIGA